ncbi:N-acetyltransferase [Paenibacillus psychroresistens]|uniref:N-acetyltransferase n=1 Tax=Paenibacillus psychroresistens TaxID=1778678 RepID=A0A6B8RP63_9BACL|nr:GNAT family N-acetyltransferase [Paenibacillus psychroresistens]QGQ98151.1 N-acetyltransferase [Paenibacillus psychroresistens]
MTQNIIRWAQMDDIHDLAYVYSESYRKAYVGIIPDEFLDQVSLNERDQYFRKSLSEDKQKIAIMSLDEKAIGLLIFDFQGEADLPENSAEILAIYLMKDYWGSGFGKLFLNWGMDRINELGYANVFLGF